MSYQLDSGKPITENSGGLGCSRLDTRLDQARHTHVVQLLFLLVHDLACSHPINMIVPVVIANGRVHYLVSRATR